MGRGKGGGSQTVEQQADPWEGQQPYLREVFSQAQNLYNNGGLASSYYPAGTVAPMDNATQTALDLQEQRALAGNAGLTAAQGQLESTLGGNYLDNNPFMNTDGNPYLDEQVQRAIGQTNAGVNGNFAAAGRYGSGAHAAAAQDAAGNIATQMYGQAYDNDRNRALSAWQSERQNQMNGMGLAPSLAQADYQDMAALSEVGTARENYNQELLNADIDRYNYNAGADAQALQNYANLINGNYGVSGTSTTSGTSRTNPLGGAISGGGLGYLLGGATGGAVGAGLGGLLSLF